MLLEEFLSCSQARKTDEYLRTFLQDPSPTAQLQAIFARCCIEASQVDINRVRLHDEIDAYVAMLCAHPEPDSLDLDPMLVLDAHTILTKAKRMQYSGFEQLLKRMADELRQQATETLQLGRVRLMAETLRKLGYETPRTKPGGDASKLLRSPSAWLSAPIPALDDMLDHLLAGGQVLVDQEAQMLSLIALAELRNYHLDIGAKITRLLLKRGIQNEMVCEALTYLLLQRRNDGAYGFITPFEEETWVRATVDRQTYLPLTLNVFWTLYEACEAGVMSPGLVETAAA